MLRCSRRFLSTLALVATFASVHAAELGEVRVSSRVGQPLVADIELAMIDDPATPVAVRLASPEVYNGAGIAMPPVLSSVNLSVMKRDGRQFLHVTSLRPVDAEHLHLYLELVDKGQRSVRLATLWLTADPNPAPAAIPVPAPAPVPAVVAHAEPAPRPTVIPVSAPPAKRLQARPAAVKTQPEPKAAAPAPVPAPAPLSIHVPQPAAPAACVHQAEQAKVCAALDGKNAALKAQIGQLEGKVKVLQQSLGAPAAAAEAASVPAVPKPINAIKPLVLRKPRASAPEPETGMPWGWIGAGAALLLALGGILLLLRRRARTVRNVDIPAAPRLVERLRDRFPARTKPEAEASQAAKEAAEPSFD
jgi:hypothetical protein